MKKNIVVIGGSGLIGSQIIQRFEFLDGYDTVMVDYCFFILFNFFSSAFSSVLAAVVAGFFHFGVGVFTGSFSSSTGGVST